MNKNDNRFTEALASALHKMVERERSGAVDCYGWNYQPKRPEALTRDPNETKNPASMDRTPICKDTITDATRTRKKVIYEKLLFTITRINVQLYFYGLCICSRTLR